MRAAPHVIALIVCLSLQPQAGHGQDQTVLDGVYNREQAQAGRVLYEQKCRHCHDLEFYRDSLRSWVGMTLLDFWYRILGNMPADKPRTLSDTQYLDLVAYILSVNDLPAGETPLQPSNSLGKIRIVAPQD